MGSRKGISHKHKGNAIGAGRSAYAVKDLRDRPAIDARLLEEGIASTYAVMNRNIADCLFGPRETHAPSLRGQAIRFFSGIKRRICNAYDCLVKGVDPYDEY